MKKKHNLFVVAEKETNRAIALVDKAVSLHFSHNPPIYNILPVANTGVTTQRTDKGTITSMSINIDSEEEEEEEEIYYLITDWPDKITIEEAYEIICSVFNHKKS